MPAPVPQPGCAYALALIQSQKGEKASTQAPIPAPEKVPATALLPSSEPELSQKPVLVLPLQLQPVSSTASVQS